MMEELKQCPLCGGEAAYESTQHKHGIVYSVYIVKNVGSK